jgi:ATP-dependent DNA helicase RecG
MAAVAAGRHADDVESQTLDFKQEQASLKHTLRDLAEAAVCFANADGGTLVVGVRDAAGLEAIAGASAALSADVVRRGIFDRTHPALTVLAERWRVSDLVRGADGEAEILVVTVPPGVVPCSTADGTATRRLGKECRPFTPEQQRGWLIRAGQLDWSSSPCDVHPATLDERELARVKRLLSATGRSELSRQSPDQILRDLRLLDEHGKCRSAAILLLGSPEQIREIAPTHGLTYQFRPAPGIEATAVHHDDGPLLAVIERAIELVAARSLQRPVALQGGAQVALVDYPGAAVREIVVNALLHRDYETHGVVQIEHSPEQLTISSPGGLVFGVTPDNILTHPSTPRNRCLFEAVSMLGIAERTGQGIDRAYRELLRLGRAPVNVHDSGTLTSVELTGGRASEAFARFVGSLDDPDASDLDSLLVLRALCQRRTLSAAQLAPLIQRSVDQARHALARMASATDPLIEATVRRGSYRLTTPARIGLGRAVRYHAALQGDLDEKVASHIREYGTITNRTLQRLFDLSVWSARDALRDLQSRGVVTKLSSQSSGPGVQYGPGPNIESSTKSRRRGSAEGQA